MSRLGRPPSRRSVDTSQPTAICRRKFRGARPARATSSLPEHLGDQSRGLFLDLRQVFGAPEALGVNLVDVLGARGAGGEPAVLGDHLEATYLLPVPARPRELLGDRIA